MSFHDSMLEEGFSDEEEYLRHLFETFDNHQEQLNFNPNEDSFCNIDEDDDDDPWAWDEERLNEEKRYLRKWCKENPQERENFFLSYHLSYDILNYQKLSDLLDRWDNASYNEWIASYTFKNDYGSYWEWIADNKLENFFSGIMFEEIDDCYDYIDHQEIYNEDKAIQTRVTSWQVWEDVKKSFYNWVNSASNEEKNAFFKDINADIHQQKGMFSSIMQYYINIKEKLFEEECNYLINYLFTNIKETYSIFYKTKCYKKYELLKFRK